MSDETLAYLLSRVRLELGDQASPFDERFFADGIETQFQIDHRPLKRDSLTVTIDGVTTNDWTVDSRHGAFIFDTAPSEGAVIEITGVRFRYFNDDDINVFCQESLREHSRGRLDNYGVQTTVDRIPLEELHPIAVRAIILALWALLTDASFDIDIHAPDGVSIPRSQRFQQLMEALTARQAEYDALAKALNIGLFRTEVYTLRRIAKRTNRLVPLYVTQEYDDSMTPQRIYTEVSTQGWSFPVEDAATVDLVLRKGSAFDQVIVLNKDLTPFDDLDAVITAQVLTYPGQSVPRATFEVTVTDLLTGTVELTMTPDQSRWVPNVAYWQMITSTEEGGGFLLAQGRVQAERAVTPAPPAPIVDPYGGP